MKRILVILSVVIMSCTTSTTSSQVVKNIEAQMFSSLMQKKGSIILDVRTPQEFASGHINQATNIDFYSSDFKKKLSLVNKEVPVFVYCRSGNRSGKSAEIMKALGFKEVHNLIGGIGAWNAKGFKVVKGKNANKKPQVKYTSKQIEKLVYDNKLVLIDFSTEWCVPCKRMKPLVKEIQQEQKDVEVLFVDVDANSELATKYSIKSVPTFLVFKEGGEVFRHNGLIEKSELIKQLK